MSNQTVVRFLAVANLAAVIFNINAGANAVVMPSRPAFLSAPTFSPATNAPLAGLLQLTTDEPCRVSVAMSNGTNVWEKDFYDYATTNALPLYGFLPDTTNLITVTVFDRNRDSNTFPQTLTFVTAPLPADFPEYTVLQENTNLMQPGYTMFTVHCRDDSAAYINIVDSSGRVVWYCPAFQSSDIDVDQLDNGNLFIHEQPPANQFLEVNLLGEIVRTWPAAPGYPVNSHVGILTSHGTILYLSDVSEVVSNYPTELPYQGYYPNPPVDTVSVDDNPVVEISATNGALLNVWSSLSILDPTRTTYLTGDFPSPIDGTVDAEHANAIVDDTNDNSIIVSQRDENTIYKFSRNTGQLKWILAPHVGWSTNLDPYLLTPTGSPFDWCYGQHAPELTPQGTLLVFDDGYVRASPWDAEPAATNSYSRAVEYSIDETNMTISQVWDTYDSGQSSNDLILSWIMGNVDWEPQHNTILTTYAWVNCVNGIQPQPSASASPARIVEYTHTTVPQVVFDLSVWDYGDTSQNSALGFYVYRSHRIPDLYAHPAEPVEDLEIGEQHQMPLLEFSADPVHSYLIQSSTNLKSWATIGTAMPQTGTGEYDFNNLEAGSSAFCFYRVVTQ